ncbi:MAG: phosphomannomutase/phosphoglucomutase [Clostridia bacterium]|nr:phosphomannomutase/phosphoglucomutase [Clostridia bacterium]
MTNLRALISGSDVRGRALGEGAVLTSDVALTLGAAFAAFLKKRGAAKPLVYIGRDSRLSGKALMNAFTEGLRAAGAHVIRVGMCTTPAMYMALITEGWGGDGSVMVTASHLPPERNGFKFFLPEGGIGLEELDGILSLAESGEDFSAPGGVAEDKEFLPAYQGLLKKRIVEGLGTDEPKPLQGLHIAVDAGNGAGGFYATFLQSLGADTSGSRYLEPDGRFPNHIPNPENEAAMASISDAVQESGADMGVIFDTDCDRAAIVDGEGKEINRNRLIALVSAVLLSTAPGITVVTDSVTSSGLKTFITERGGVHYRYKRGYHNVIEEARRLNAEGADCPLAMETSGHAALRENHFLDDGMYLVTVLICEAMRMKRQGKSLFGLIDDLKEPLEGAEVRLKITADDFRTAGNKAIDKVISLAQSTPGWTLAPDNREGVRVSLDLDGQKESAWFLLRLSVHDPVLPLNLESDVKGGNLTMAKALCEALKDNHDLDLEPLKNFIRQEEEKHE